MTQMTPAYGSSDPGFYRPAIALHANSTPLERHAYKETKEVYAAFLKGISALRHALLQSAGSANTMTMERAIGDLMGVTPREIYDQMHLLHGTLNLSDIEKLEQKLLKPLASISTFEAHANTFQLNLHALDRADAKPIPKTIYRTFRSTMKAFPQFIPFQSNFDIAFPAPEDKTYEAYVGFITPTYPLSLPNPPPTPLPDL
jgi:hypothetical protein